MFGLGIGEIFLILVFALIFIGPKKLPELAKNLGKSLREFQKAKDDLMAQVHTETHDVDDHSHVDSLDDSKISEEEYQGDHHSALIDDTLNLQEDESIVATKTMDLKAEPTEEYEADHQAENKEDYKEKKDV